MTMDALNPRAVIGGNNPPEPTAIELATPHIDALRQFLNNSPVISTEEEAREGAKAMGDAAAALKSVEVERKSKVDPLNAELKKINGEYFKLHCTSGGKPGVWDKLLSEVKRRLTDYAKGEERKRFKAEEAARRAAEEAAEAARQAAEREREAREEAAAGTCDVNLDAAIETADTLSQQAIRARWNAQRTEAQTKVRITGGPGRAMSLREHETLHVTDWRAAIEEMTGDDGRIPQTIADAILKCARTHRDMSGALPPGIAATYDRSL